MVWFESFQKAADFYGGDFAAMTAIPGCVLVHARGVFVDPRLFYGDQP